MSDQFVVDTEALDYGGRVMEGATEDFRAAVQRVMAAAGDTSALGGNDMVGGVAAMLYQTFLDHVEGCATSLEGSFGGHGNALKNAARMRRDTEANNAALMKEF